MARVLRTAIVATLLALVSLLPPPAIAQQPEAPKAPVVVMPEDVEAAQQLLEQAKALEQACDRKGALDAYLAALDGWPAGEDAGDALVAVVRLADDPEQLREALKLAEDSGPGQGMYWGFARAAAYAKLKDYEKMGAAVRELTLVPEEGDMNGGDPAARAFVEVLSKLCETSPEAAAEAIIAMVGVSSPCAETSADGAKRVEALVQAHPTVGAVRFIAMIAYDVMGQRQRSAAEAAVLAEMAKTGEGDAELLALMVRMREQAVIAACMSNLKQLALGVMMYAADHGDALPPDATDAIFPYLRTRELFRCPNDKEPADQTSYVYLRPAENLAQIEDPATTPLLECHHHEGVIIVAYADGHVARVPKEPPAGP